MRRGKCCAWLGVIAISASLVAMAEVSARLDDGGRYVCMVFKYNASASAPRIWAASTLNLQRRPLNPLGDLVGDLAPTVVENPVLYRWPTAVWSHPNGGDYDLLFSRWTGAQWAPPQFVQNDNAYNEVEPRFGFNSQGRAYMVWWSDENGVGAVYFSLMLDTRWLTAVRVSDEGIDSRHATISIESDSIVHVVYEAGRSAQNRTVEIPLSDTINDDIDPKLRAQISIY